MRQLTFVAPGHLEWRDVSRPVLSGDAQAIVRPIAVARCDLDLYMATGRYPARGPFAFGHETVAVVEEVGDEVQHWSPGDRVIVPFQIHCGECGNCRRGWTNACARETPCAAYGLGRFGGGDYGGGLSDALLVPWADAMLVRLPVELSAATAAGLSDNVADGYRTVAPGLLEDPGAPVLVVGGLAQSVGLYAAQAAVALGSERVVYSDWSRQRLAVASSLGAEPAEIDYRGAEASEHFGRRGFPIVVHASGEDAGLRFAIAATAPCGRLTSVSGVTAELALQSAYLRGLTLDVSRVHSHPNLLKVLDLCCRGALDPMANGARLVDFAEAADAMTAPDVKIIFVTAEAVDSVQRQGCDGSAC